MDNLSLLSYTSKDYNNIYQELKAAVPLVSKLWDTDSESDPGNVLIKLISMLGDMLSYNFDAQVLELFPNTVTQRKNARQVFSLIGYKTHWYRSAKCTIELRNISARDGIVPIYTLFSDKNKSITYTNIRQYTLPGSEDITTPVELIQGIPVTPTKLDSNAVSKYDINWSDIYDFNVTSNMIVNNKLYFSKSNIDESTIRLIDEYGTEWTQVENLEAQTEVGKMYEFKVDNSDNPYIELCDYWQSYNCNNFKLFYILSLGEAGQISENTIVNIDSAIVSRVHNTVDNVISTIRINNDIYITECTASTEGYYPEEANEARLTASNYVNTYDTLVTLDDFSKAIKRLDGIANCIATDYTTDPYMAKDYSSDTEEEMDPDKYLIKLYIVRSPEYEEVDKESFKSAMISSLYDKKMIPLNVEVDLDNIDRYQWTVQGTVYLVEPVSNDRANQILLKINSALNNKYNINKSEFNEVVKYIDVVNEITSTDPLIKYVELKDIKYVNNNTEVSAEEITGRYTESIEYYQNDAGLYSITLKNTPIKPGSVCIRYQNIIITDNKNGKLNCNNTVFFNKGTVSYRTGEIQFYLYNNQIAIDDFKVTYKKNKIGIIEYKNYNVGDFKISEDSIVAEEYRWRYLNA